MTPVLLDTAEAVARGAGELAPLCAGMARLVAENGPPVLRRRPAGFAGLASIVVGQQVSTASAAAIWARCLSVFDPFEPARLAAGTDAEFVAAGLSRPKIRTLRALAAVVEAGDLPLADLAALDADGARAALTAIGGIGPWTAEIYLLFCLGHPDAFAAGDLALQEAARLVFGLPARPDARALAALAETWRPWRGVAAHLLWEHYRRAKSREGILAGGPAAEAAPRAPGRPLRAGRVRT